MTTNKVIATIAGDVFGKDVQAYPKYGSEKKGLPTTYYLTIAEKHVMLHSELEYVDLVVLNDTTALFSGNPLDGMLPGGAVVMQSSFTRAEGRVGAHSGPPSQVHSRESHSRLTTPTWCRSPARWRRWPTCRCACRASCCLGAFLKLTPYASESGMTDDHVYEGVEKALRKYFGKRGDRVVQDNLHCVKRGYKEVREVPQEMMQA